MTAEIVAGIAAPLGVALLSWALARRTYLRNPEALTSLMMAAFAGKMLFFGAYVALMLRLLSLRPIPFMASFTASFIACHLIEALGLRRLFMRAPRPAEGAWR